MGKANFSSIVFSNYTILYHFDNESMQLANWILTSINKCFKEIH